MKIETHWTVRRDGDFGYVREKSILGDVEYGPMPRDFAGPFIDERRESIEASVKKVLARTVADLDYGSASDILAAQRAINQRRK